MQGSTRLWRTGVVVLLCLIATAQALPAQPAAARPFDDLDRELIMLRSSAKGLRSLRAAADAHASADAPATARARQLQAAAAPFTDWDLEILQGGFSNGISLAEATRSCVGR